MQYNNKSTFYTKGHLNSVMLIETILLVNQIYINTYHQNGNKVIRVKSQRKIKKNDYFYITFIFVSNYENKLNDMRQKERRTEKSLLAIKFRIILYCYLL